MRACPIFVAAVAIAFALPACAAASPAAILAANRAATAGRAWSGKATLVLAYAYAGQGMTGTTRSLEEVADGAFVDSYRIGPDAGANGFDGTRAWLREPSGTVTWQGGGDSETLAVNESYRDRNSWWRADFGGAHIVSDGQKADRGRAYDVLTVTPAGGKPFDAWFDAKTHLLARTREVQGTLAITTFLSHYAPVDGVRMPHLLVIDDGTGVANRQRLALTAAKFGPARPLGDFEPPSQHLNDSRIVGGATQTTVPFRLINNHIYANVSIDGSAPLQFLFDTGGHDILTPPTAKSLGVTVVGASPATGAGNNVSTSGNSRVRSIRIGNAVVTDQPVTVLQFDNPVEGVDEQGMIGYEVFARFVTQIDYGRQTLTLIDPNHFDAKDAGLAVPFRFYAQFPEILGSYEGIPGRFGIDTGARDALSLNRVFAEQHDLRARAGKGVVAVTGWGVGGPTRSFVSRGGELKLGDVSIAHPIAEISLDTGGSGGSAAFPNNVGAGVLKRFVVTLDYAHERIFFKPAAAPIPDLDTFDRSGMWINAQRGGFLVVDVTPGGPAEHAGLAKNDVILAVDGKPASNIALADLRRELRDEKSGTVVVFAVKTARGMRSIPITLRDQI